MLEGRLQPPAAQRLVFLCRTLDTLDSSKTLIVQNNYQLASLKLPAAPKNQRYRALSSLYNQNFQPLSVLTLGTFLKTVNNQTKHLQVRGSALIWILVWLVGLTAIAWTGLNYAVPKFEQKLQTAVDGSIETFESDSVSVTMLGRDAMVSGDVSSPEDEMRVLAAVRSTPGVGLVSSALTVVAASSNEPNERVSPTIQVATAEILPPQVAVATIAIVEPTPEKQPSPTVVVEPAAVKLSPPAVVEAVPADVADEDAPLLLALNDTVITKPKDILKQEPSISIQVFGNILSIEGMMASSDDTSELVKNALNSFDRDVVSNGLSQQDDVKKAEWLTALLQIMPLMDTMSDAKIGIENQQMTLAGVAPNKTAHDAVINKALSSMGRLSLVEKIKIDGNGPDAAGSTLVLSSQLGKQNADTAAKARETARLEAVAAAEAQDAAADQAAEKAKEQARIAEAAAAKAKADEQARLAAEAAAKAKADEDARLAAEAAAKAKADEQARLTAEAAAKAKADEQARLAAEAAAKAKADEAARLAAQAAAKAKADEEERLAAEAAAKAKADEDAKLAEEAAAKAKADEQARLAAKAAADEKARLAAEAAAAEEARLAAQAAAKAEAKAKAAEQARLAAQAAAKARADEQARLAAEEKLKAEEKAKADEQARLAVVAKQKAAENNIDAALSQLPTLRILFDSHGNRLTAESYDVLDQIADILLQHPDGKLTIEGHTDSTGGPRLNLQLSLRRATTVRDYLIQRGISTYNLRAIGFGADMPLASNDTPEGRAINRRIEFTFR